MDEADLPVVGDPHAQALHDGTELGPTGLVANQPGQSRAIGLELHELAVQRREPPRLGNAIAATPDDRRSDDHEPHE